MRGALGNRDFRHLFASQLMSLVGIGLMTVALALLAFDIGGPAQAGLVLSGVFTIKMIAYVGFAPIANSLVGKLPVKPLLIGLDAARLGLALLLPLAGAIWQVYLLTLLFQMCSATFTPAYQSTIPEVLEDEAQYTAALSLSRVAYNLETMLSPIMAGVLLLLVAPPALFLGTALAFALSGMFLATTSLPARVVSASEPFRKRLVKGFTIYLHTTRLRGLLAISFATSLTMAWVLVNSVAYAGLRFDGNAGAYTDLMAAFGAGSIAAAVTVPRLLRHLSERRVMISGAFGLGALASTILLEPGYGALLALWAGLGAMSSLVLTPGALLIVRSSARENRPALFAAQFSLSHAAWLIAYPLSGWLGTVVGLENALVALGLSTVTIAFVTARVWPAHDPLEREHLHDALPLSHPHIQAGPYRQLEDGRGILHSHDFRIDDLHPRWPTAAAHVQHGTSPRGAAARIAGTRRDGWA